MRGRGVVKSEYSDVSSTKVLGQVKKSFVYNQQTEFKQGPLGESHC